MRSRTGPPLGISNLSGDNSDAATEIGRPGEETSVSAIWQWPKQDPTYATYGNANQWTVNAGMTSLARESAQNSNDARLPDTKAQLVYSFIRLSGTERTAFLEAAGWSESLHAHLRAMASDSKGSVAAGQ